ncbi:hypothetical protein, partial [Bacillus sp. JJ1474]|uniref:hypothetical protein n=1 Tax=Bacillus sp. JJ1474 TaxID=3122955 RepID=UPI0030006FB2
MKVKVNLSHNEGFRWFQRNGLYVKGFLFDKNGNLYKDENLVEYFHEITDGKYLDEKLRYANGSFCLVFNNGKNVYIAADRLRSIPLFYSILEDQILISDNAFWIKKESNLHDIDQMSLLEFKLTGYTMGSTTLIRKINQIQAGELVTIKLENTTKIFNEFYYVHLHNNYFGLTKNECFDQLEEISKRTFTRLIKSVNNNPIVVPLSGGYDSRYIVAMLKKLGYENVICYTYGRPDSHEVVISIRVAKQLSYDWIFIEYSIDTWDCLFGDDAYKYFIDSNNLSSLPHIQEYYAVQYLSNNKLIPENSVIVPGFCGDVLGGTYLIDENGIRSIDLDVDSLCEYIFKKHFNLFVYNGEKVSQIKKDIKQFIVQFPISNVDDLISINEHFITCHRLSKFVINSLR